MVAIALLVCVRIYPLFFVVFRVQAGPGWKSISFTYLYTYLPGLFLLFAAHNSS